MKINKTISIPQSLKSKINNYLNKSQKKQILFTKTNKDLNKNKLDLILNLHKSNDIRRLNKFYEKVNECLDDNGIFISCSETLEQRRKRMKSKVPLGFKNIVRVIDFIYKRFFPKIPLLKSIYFLISKGKNRVISKGEFFGRLYSCGFKIIKYFEIENKLFIVSKKVKKPDFNMNPSYGPIFKMKRVGFKGKLIEVYKLRTMHPYSEYCQELIIEENKLAPSGKIANDYRVTTWGKIFRRVWIDELPMLINLFKGDLNIVGVRPLSKNYFSKYPIALQELRIKVKPGLIPPYYADLPKNFDEILESEKKYIKQKIKKPFYTDLKYLVKALINIIFHGARTG